MKSSLGWIFHLVILVAIRFEHHVECAGASDTVTTSTHSTLLAPALEHIKSVESYLKSYAAAIEVPPKKTGGRLSAKSTYVPISEKYPEYDEIKGKVLEGQKLRTNGDFEEVYINMMVIAAKEDHKQFKIVLKHDEPDPKASKPLSITGGIYISVLRHLLTEKTLAKTDVDKITAVILYYTRPEIIKILQKDANYPTIIEYLYHLIEKAAEAEKLHPLLRQFLINDIKKKLGCKKDKGKEGKGKGKDGKGKKDKKGKDVQGTDGEGEQGKDGHANGVNGSDKDKGKENKDEKSEKVKGSKNKNGGEKGEKKKKGGPTEPTSGASSRTGSKSSTESTDSDTNEAPPPETISETDAAVILNNLPLVLVIVHAQYALNTVPVEQLAQGEQENVYSAEKTFRNLLDILSAIFMLSNKMEIHARDFRLILNIAEVYVVDENRPAIGIKGADRLKKTAKSFWKYRTHIISSTAEEEKLVKRLNLLVTVSIFVAVISGRNIESDPNVRDEVEEAIIDLSKTMFTVLSCPDCPNDFKIIEFEGMHVMLCFYRETVFAHTIFKELLMALKARQSLPKIKQIKKKIRNGGAIQRKWSADVTSNEFPTEIIRGIRDMFHLQPVTAD